jgi:hypothetical protein
LCRGSTSNLYSSNSFVCECDQDSDVLTDAPVGSNIISGDYDIFQVGNTSSYMPTNKYAHGIFVGIWNNGNWSNVAIC